jgi:hypothetical protein
MFSFLLREQKGKRSLLKGGKGTLRYESQPTCLKLSGLHLGLILNFNVTMMRDGIRRIVHELAE